MAKIIKAPRGTQDITGAESYKWQFVEDIVITTSKLYGFKEMRTPTFEDMSLFKRSVGDTTDVVQKEMYQVQAEKGKDLYGLKPEGTAGAVRAVIERGLLNEALPVKISYLTPCFRHERPQAGRLREFHQFGIEMFGASSPSADVEIISVAKNIFDMIGLKNITLYINSIGCPVCRANYHKALTDYFKKYTETLCGTCNERLDKNPMRILDCKSPVCTEITKGAPIILDYLCDECKNHFDGVKTRLDKLNIEYTVNPKIVRGLDYYTKTVFEFVSNDLGAQSTVCGGGRYDGLVAQMGGNQTPALGFGMGIERLLLVMEAQNIEIPKPLDCELYIASMGENANIKACEITNKLREEGFYVECDLLNRSVKAQMKYANKINAKTVVVLGDSELENKKAKLKIMATGEEIEIDFENNLSEILHNMNVNEITDSISKEFGVNDLGSLLNFKG